MLTAAEGASGWRGTGEFIADIGRLACAIWLRAQPVAHARIRIVREPAGAVRTDYGSRISLTVTDLGRRQENA
jgi:hypothetical protein